MEGRAPPPPKTNPTREQIDEAAAIQRAQQAQQEILEAQEALAQLEALFYVVHLGSTNPWCCGTTRQCHS